MAVVMTACAAAAISLETSRNPNPRDEKQNAPATAEAFEHSSYQAHLAGGVPALWEGNERPSEPIVICRVGGLTGEFGGKNPKILGWARRNGRPDDVQQPVKFGLAHCALRGLSA